MKFKYFLIATIGFVVGWNVFLIQRDFNSIRYYDHPKLEELK
jgi:hypothetical protein